MMRSVLEENSHPALRFLRKSLTSGFSLIDLDRKDTTILKGLAIFFIVFHNFFHVIGRVHENEFTFDPSRFPIFLDVVRHPSTTIQALFSFYGHFGVQVFIFLSAYGLAKSHWDDDSSWASFMWSRVKKFYPMFLLVILFWAVLAAIHVGPMWVIINTGPGLLLLLAGVSNIWPGQGLPPIGPWWFIPFIMQFYAIWPMLRKLARKFGWQGLVVVSVVAFLVTLALNPVLSPMSIRLSESPLGRMRVICLGILAARYPIKINAWLGVLAIAVMIIGSDNSQVAYLTSLASVVMSLWLYMHTRALLRRFHVIEQIGNYSLGIFLVNGIVRVPFVMFAKSPLSQFTLACVSAVVSFAIAAFFHYLMEPRPARASVTAFGHWQTAHTAEGSAE